MSKLWTRSRVEQSPAINLSKKGVGFEEQAPLCKYKDPLESMQVQVLIFKGHYENFFFSVVISPGGKQMGLTCLK